MVWLMRVDTDDPQIRVFYYDDRRKGAICLQTRGD